MKIENLNQYLSLAKDALNKIYELQVEALKKKYIEIQEEISEGTE
jgi:hypothetical protein